MVGLRFGTVRCLIQYFQVAIMRLTDVAFYPEGISQHSPGLPLRLPWGYGSDPFLP